MQPCHDATITPRRWVGILAAIGVEMSASARAVIRQQKGRTYHRLAPSLNNQLCSITFADK